MADYERYVPEIVETYPVTIIYIILYAAFFINGGGGVAEVTLSLNNNIVG